MKYLFWTAFGLLVLWQFVAYYPDGDSLSIDSRCYGGYCDDARREMFIDAQIDQFMHSQNKR